MYNVVEGHMKSKDPPLLSYTGWRPVVAVVVIVLARVIVIVILLPPVLHKRCRCSTTSVISTIHTTASN